MPVYIASSAWFIAIASGFYLSAALAILLIAWPCWLSGLCLLGLLFDYQRIIKLHGLRTHRSSVLALLADCDKWRYRLASGGKFKAKLIKHKSYCSRIVLILYLSHMRGGRYIVIPRDALSRRNYRSLALKINS